MKRSTIFLQAAVILTGTVALFFMLYEPLIEGRNAHSTFFEIYFNDPFLAFAYTASIPFFIALYNAVKVLGSVRQNKTYTQPAVKALRTIKYCGLSLIGFALAGEIIIMLNNSDDRAGGVFMGFLAALLAIALAAAGFSFERKVQKRIDEKSGKN